MAQGKVEKLEKTLEGLLGSAEAAPKADMAEEDRRAHARESVAQLAAFLRRLAQVNKKGAVTVPPHHPADKGPAFKFEVDRSNLLGSLLAEIGEANSVKMKAATGYEGAGDAPSIKACLPWYVTEKDAAAKQHGGSAHQGARDWGGVSTDVLTESWAQLCGKPVASENEVVRFSSANEKGDLFLPPMDTWLEDGKTTFRNGALHTEALSENVKADREAQVSQVRCRAAVVAWCRHRGSPPAPLTLPAHRLQLRNLGTLMYVAVLHNEPVPSAVLPPLLSSALLGVPPTHPSYVAAAAASCSCSSCFCARRYYRSHCH